MEKATPLAYGQRLPIAWCRRGRRVAFGSALSQGRVRENGAMLFAWYGYESARDRGPVMTCQGPATVPAEAPQGLADGGIGVCGKVEMGQ